jgi:DNA-directed RNA polymerase II subunit RPB2
MELNDKTKTKTKTKRKSVQINEPLPKNEPEINEPLPKNEPEINDPLPNNDPLPKNESQLNEPINHEELAWKIIDKYFAHDPNILVKHHLESYNDFFNNKIHNIFKEKNPILIMKEQDEETKEYNYKAELYIGGSSGKLIYFGKPIIYDEHREHYMFPNEARLRNMTYALTLHVDVEVIYYIMNEDGVYVETRSLLEKMYLGKFPIMLNSDLCILNGLDKITRFNMGECRNDRGGYFIIDGKEKVLISQEKFADNMLYIKSDFNELYSHSAEIRSVSEDASKPIRTFSIRILRPDTKHSNNQILVNIPNVRKPVPLFILMRALGITSDKEIIKMCLLDLKKYENYITLFTPSIYDAGNIFNQEVALKYLATLTKGKTLPHILEILMDYLLPHIGENNFIDKAFFIGHMVKELLQVYKNDKKPTDRDSFRFKRVELAGTLIYDLFKEYYSLQQKHIFQKIDKEYYYKQGIYQKDFISLIENNYLEYFKERVLENGFRKAFKGNWGAEEHTKRPEVVQDLNRLSYNSFLSHLRKMNLPLDSSAKVIGPRLLHSSQWGIIDPVDTPDGGNVGLHKHMSLGCLITSGYSGKTIIELLRTVFFMELLNECVIEYIAHATKVFVNGAWSGIVTKPVEVIDMLKKYRRIGLIPIYTSISWSIKDDIIYIYSDSGRLTRPVLYLNNNKPCYESEIIYNKMQSNDFTYNELLIGFNKFKLYNSEKRENNLTSSDVINSNNVFFNYNELYDKPNTTSTEHALDELMVKAGIIDYLDTAESETALIANYSEQITKFTSHCEIHASLTLGVMGNQIVFPENNQLPRDLFACGQSKQAVSLYNSNYQNRIDKMGVILNNGQIPLVKSRYLKYMYNEEHTCGVNAIVAIGSYGGYNVEDSILFNEGSINRGMFNTTYFNMYESREESTKVAGSNIDTRFINIESKNVVGKKPGYDYSLLDANGLIRENSPLDDRKIVIGKVTTNISNPDTFSDASISPKKGQLGYVDKAFITEGEEGFRIAKVRIREERQPAQGDKFCSRCGQKGTVGLIIPEENMPFNADGIRPDLIINPHALPSRMTIGQLVETLMGKACVYYGGFGDCTAFVNKGSKHELFGSLLRNIGYSSTGNELMYSGETGEQLTMEFFMGPCYYMRLKHMVKDKINYRAQGPRTMITRQTVQGRANDGGLRIGEMERDGIIAHGATAFLKESMLDRGDDYYVAICNTSGTIAIYNESKNIFISPFSDGPLKFAENFENTMNLEVISKYGKSFSIVRVPYSFKLLIQELQVMNIQMRIITEDNIDQLTSMNYAKTIQNLKLTKLSRKEEEEYNKKYDGKSYDGVRSREKPKTTQEVIEEDNKKEMIDLAEKGAIMPDKLISEGDDTEDEDNNDGLSQVTIDSIKRAEDEFSRYQDLDDENEPIKIGDVVNEDELGIEDLNDGKNSESSQESKSVSFMPIEDKNVSDKNVSDKNVSDKNVSILQSEIKPILLENITSETPAEVEKINTEKSENMKTIVIANQ